MEVRSASIQSRPSTQRQCVRPGSFDVLRLGAGTKAPSTLSRLASNTRMSAPPLAPAASGQRLDSVQLRLIRMKHLYQEEVGDRPIASQKGVEECNSSSSYDRLISQDRERHRRELDGVWKREQSARAYIAELSVHLEAFKRRDSEVRRQLLSMREAVSRHALKEEQQRELVELCIDANRRLAMLAVLRTARPPVRDSELIRALKRAERRVLQLEGRESLLAPDAVLELEVPRPGTTPAGSQRRGRPAPPLPWAVHRVGPAHIDELETLDAQHTQQPFQPFLSIVR